MRDNEIIANQVSALRRSQGLSFDQAFVLTMKQYPTFRGRAWSQTKSQVGKILQARKKLLKKKKAPHRKNVRAQPTDCMETLPLDFGSHK